MKLPCCCAVAGIYAVCYSSRWQLASWAWTNVLQR